ncbi:MAG TPA: hypothetical protein VEO36_08655, partial [Casimicrobiaceae bacterium]|nr:hypothetical protein [Casimicrobiaceae bacterium]
SVLCYGDSITWGFNPADETRFAFDVRWPGVVQTVLGADYSVIEEGLSGRTVATESWVLPNRDGRAMLVPADACGAKFLDASRVVRASEVDGVRLDADGHGKLGTAIADIISAADRAAAPRE